ncbi:DUF4249 domain-containing protein [Flavobacterium enshiense]|uniref:DUF4249 domain-containing protein n=1 Tax=Flavobacterium enshiense TaxID=1341165 RepID=UPI00345D4DDE
MKKANTSYFTTIAIFLLFCIGIAPGCTEPYQMTTNTFENILVVEATLTNELKKQQIKLSRTYRLEEEGPIIEEGATVYVLDDTGTRYDFIEQDSIYESEAEFQAVPERRYQLFIFTRDGKEYTSNEQQLTTANPINDVSATVDMLEGVRGVSLKAHSYDPTNSSKFYRYEYEETYKIIAPYWVYVKMIATGEESIAFVPRDYEARVCYTTEKSKDIILTTTVGQTQDQVDHPVRFISQQNPIIMHRYSILVTQYVQNQESYNFYKNLKNISSTGNGGLLSPIQPGFFNGNIKSVNNVKEKVVGFFEVSSVSKKRIFFNYTDLFPNEHLPPYFVDCEGGSESLVFCFDPRNDVCDGWNIISYARTQRMLFYQYIGGMTYVFVPPPCGDCTTFSSNVIPPFWQ